MKELVDINRNLPSAEGNPLREKPTKRRRSGTLLLFLLSFSALLAIVVAFCGYKLYFAKLKPNHSVPIVVDKQYQFGDVNALHLQAAKKNGIKPVQKRSQINFAKLEKVNTCDYYTLDKLTHSVPYLIPKSKTLLDDIGKRFQEELANQGFRKHCIIVTSVLRSKEDVQKLRGTNGNASKNSAHFYATTFDITYIRFKRVSYKGEPVSNHTMANILGKVLKDLRDKGRCYVKFERNQRCFHITCR